MNRIRSNGFAQSIQSLSLVMPTLTNDLLLDQDDKFCTETSKGWLVDLSDYI